jgi:hypothetical protein
MKAYFKMSAAILAMASLSACGGGGGSVASTPTPPPVASPPPPPSPVNASLANLTANESFKNDAVGGTISGTTGGNSIGSVGSATATIQYDNTAKSYTISNGGQSQTFAPANQLPFKATGLPFDTNGVLTNSAPSFTAYDKSIAGSSTDQFTISSNTNPIVQSNQAAAPDLVLRYVGYGGWTKTNVSGANVTGSTVTFTYGAFTTDAALPRTGTATYRFNLSGRLFSTATLFANGTGDMSVNFAGNSLTGRTGILTEFNPATGISVLQPNGFNFSANIASATNNFTGTFNYNGSLFMSGPLNGRFYGPAAEEVGAVFSGSSSNAAILGVLVGIKR